MQTTILSACLCERTQQLVKTRPANVSYDDLSRSAKVSKRWIEAFANDRIPDPSCRRVERLYEVLTGRKVFEA
jgi:hypothetical protein